MLTASERLVWCDLETFGLTPSTDPIIEVGFVITDLDFQITDMFHGLCWDQDWYNTLYAQQYNDDSFVYKMHTDSGLWSDAIENGRSMAEIEIEVLAWFERNGIGKDDPLCGSTIDFDRKMLDMWMHNVEHALSHRSINISSLKELCKRFNPAATELLKNTAPKREMHRSIYDLEDSVTEAKFYVDNFLKVAR